MATLKYYKVDGDGKIKRLRRECPAPECGAGIFMAWHSDRQYCGKCREYSSTEWCGDGWADEEGRTKTARDEKTVRNSWSLPSSTKFMFSIRYRYDQFFREEDRT